MDAVDDWLDDRAESLATHSLHDLLVTLRRSIEHAQRRDKAEAMDVIFAQRREAAACEA
ncbi:hypothetical protein AB0N17_14930 [Streptomyces sp. NPDC051133]|uniref:hypothetical protein n=1 Tax=Streptomyces sp. NPDC051133 TaxID=3155521 RepID=UPI003434DB60